MATTSGERQHYWLLVRYPRSNYVGIWNSRVGSLPLRISGTWHSFVRMAGKAVCCHHTYMCVVFCFGAQVSRIKLIILCTNLTVRLILVSTLHTTLLSMSCTTSTSHPDRWPLGTQKYYRNNRSNNKPLVLSSHRGRAGKYKLLASQRGQRCFPCTTLGLYITNLCWPCCLGLPHTGVCKEESLPLLCDFTAMLFGSMPSVYEESME